MIEKTFCGEGGPGQRMEVPPTAKGKYNPFPRPYAKNNFAVLKKRSAWRIWSTFAAYCSVAATMLCCRWTHPFGKPVLPEEYSQNAVSSLQVRAGESGPLCDCKKSANEIVPGGA